ncbi:hypothetical protein M9H77_35921 [Catharanthus roseus]|uniref:Uncharacterized protein n=1 Tax=Catharanthus roseus TaxID=4058 RepID=A0ACB9ZSX8_CATRO|nr:hypothetical protein M9H77_35921 [Catharanthus roseus]
MPLVHAMKSTVLESIYQLSCAHKLLIDVAGFPSTFKQPVVKYWTIMVLLLWDFAHSLVLLQIAEVDGLAKGIVLYLSLGHYMVDIQSDSLVFVNTIQDWNKVADCLANYSCDLAKSQQFLSYSCLPREAGGLCFLDKLSVLAIHCTKGGLSCPSSPLFCTFFLYYQ